MLIPQPGKEDRLVIDLTPLNKITPAITHRAPRLIDVLQTATAYKWFSVIDIKGAFWFICLTEDCKHLTAFDTPWGTFEFNVLPQGWNNAPAYWQRFITHVLRKFLYSWCFASADDILVFADTKEECAYRTRKILTLLKQAGLETSEKKTVVCQNTVTFFGYKVTHQRWIPRSDTDSLRNWPTPTSKKQLQRWLGTLNTFRDHIPNLSAITQPLHHLTGDKTTWKWTEAHNHAFHESRRAALHQIWINKHEPGVTQELICDASDRGLGVILKEKSRVISIVSRKLSPAEQNYDTKQRECLAIVWGTKTLAHYTTDAPAILIKTDHHNIVTSLKPSGTDRRINRWIDWLSQFHFTTQHIPGATNPADGPSRVWDQD